MQKKNHVSDQQPLRSRTQAKLLCCPYWSASNGACLLIRDGLFLPIEQHVAAYCRTDRFPSCRHYLVLADSQTNARQEQGQPNNRRFSGRIASHHTFRFSEITNNTTMGERQEERSWTIDLSGKGICFASNHPMPPETPLAFSLESDTLSPNLEGTGRVIWCKRLDNTPFFQAGMAFTALIQK